MTTETVICKRCRKPIEPCHCRRHETCPFGRYQHITNYSHYCRGLANAVHYGDLDYAEPLALAVVHGG